MISLYEVEVMSKHASERVARQVKSYRAPREQPSQIEGFAVLLSVFAAIGASLALFFGG